MNRDWRYWTGRLLPVLVAALLAIGPVHAKDKKKKQKDVAQPAQILAKEAPKPATSAAAKQPIRRISLDKIIDEVQKRHKARVMKHEEKEKDGRTIYELRLLSDEKGVWTVRVDAETGKEL